jgi:hypothetical protein
MKIQLNKSKRDTGFVCPTEHDMRGDLYMVRFMG